MGVLINDKFFKVSIENFDEYYKLQIMALLGYMLPLFFIYKMVPSI